MDYKFQRKRRNKFKRLYKFIIIAMILDNKYYTRIG